MDIDILLFFQNIRTEFFATFMLQISELAEELPLLILIAVIYWCIDKKSGIFTAFSFHISNLTYSVLKATFCVKRSWVRDTRIVPYEAAIENATGFSFPSGHVVRTSSIMGSLAYTYRKYKSIMWLCIVFLLLTTFSRTYLGVHTPQDVLLGLFFPFLVIFLVKLLLDYIDKHPTKDIYVLIIGSVLCVGALFYFVYKSYPADMDSATLTRGAFKNAGGVIGFLIAWFCERRWVKFETRGALHQQIVKVIIGAECIYLIMVPMYSWLGQIMDRQVAAFFKGLLTALFIFVIYPLIFSKILQRINKKKEKNSQKNMEEQQVSA